VPHVVLTKGARAGLKRCQEFLAGKNQLASERAAEIIIQHLNQLETFPDLGRPYTSIPELRELVIPFGDSGYVALYRFNASSDVVDVLALRHQREVGYQ